MLLETVRRLRDHLVWADVQILETLPAQENFLPEAVREAAHLIAAEEIWLARVERRTPAVPVWPDLALPEVRQLANRTHAAWRHYLEGLRDSDLAATVNYRNSAGREFVDSVGDMLLHAALHGQYHRGKINLILRRAGLEPKPVDYIAFVRGVPAATQRGNPDAPPRQ